IYYVRSSEIAARQPHGIKPEAHRIFALTEDEDISHALHSLQRVAYVAVQVVAHEKAVILAVLRVDARTEYEVRCCRGDCQSGCVDLGRKAALSGADAILYINRR